MTGVEEHFRDRPGKNDIGREAIMRTMERQTGGFIFIVALALLPFLKAPAAAMESEAAVRFIDRLGNEAFSTLHQPGSLRTSKD